MVRHWNALKSACRGGRSFFFFLLPLSYIQLRPQQIKTFLYLFKSVPVVSSIWYLYCVLVRCVFNIYACALPEPLIPRFRALCPSFDCYIWHRLNQCDRRCSLRKIRYNLNENKNRKKNLAHTHATKLTVPSVQSRMSPISGSTFLWLSSCSFF